MGIIRKTLSVGTLGFINFRSKSELLGRAESARDDAFVSNQRLSDSNRRMTRKTRRAETRAKKAELRLLAKNGWPFRHKRDSLLGDLPSGGAAVARVTGKARRKAKRAARKVRDAAARS